MPPGSRKTFPELGRAAAGRGGMRAVFLFCSLELFGATIMLLMVAWQQLELLLPAQGEGERDGGLHGFHMAWGGSWRAHDWAAVAGCGRWCVAWMEMAWLAWGTQRYNAAQLTRGTPMPAADYPAPHLLPPLCTGLGGLTPMHLAAGLTTAALLPLLFIDLRRLAPLSGAGVVATGLVLVMVLALLGLDPRREAMPQQVRSAGRFRDRIQAWLLTWLCTAPAALHAQRRRQARPSRSCPPLPQPPPGHHSFSAGVLQSVGIFALSCSAHSTLPALRR